MSRKIKLYKIIIATFLVIALTVSVISCKEAVVEEQQQEEEKSSVEVPSETIPEETQKETPSVEEEVIEKVDAPEIKGLTFNFIFDQESKKYIDQETKEEVGVWIEDAVMINGEMRSGIALKPEAINKILEENRQKGIFKCLWMFDWQKDKGMEIVELFRASSNQQKTFEESRIYIPSPIGIRYTELNNLYASFDVNDNWDVLNELIPQKEDDPDFFSSQPRKTLVFSTEFSYKPEGLDDERHGSIQYSFIDWKSLLTLGESYKLGDVAYGQDILGQIKTGTLLGELLPKTTDINFLDFENNPKFFENPGQFQGALTVYDFQDDFSQPTSSLEKMLSYRNKAGQEIPVCVWPEENTAHEQTN